MVKGVKRIKWTGKGKVIGNLSIPNKKVVISPDQDIFFEVDLWHDGTTETDKKKSLTWMLQDRKKQIIISQRTQPSNKPKKISIPKALCGPFEYYIEASLSGNRDQKKETGLIVRGYCEPKVVTSKWCATNDGEDVRKTHVFSYGNTIYLNIETEGLNGHKSLIVDVFRKRSGLDTLVHTYTSVYVIDGEINLAMASTLSWYGKMRLVKEIEEFYVKIKDPVSGKYIEDNKQDTEHARFLRIYKKLTTPDIKPSTNLTPLKVGKPDEKAERYEPCKFETITIDKTIVFDKGSKLKKATYPKETITKTIFFDIDSSIINAEGNTGINNVLQFLLEHDHSTITINGYACVIGKENYNQVLSQKRSDAVKKVFVDRGLDAQRILSKGHGEINATDDKMGRDDIKYKEKREYIDARRVDISFVFNGHDAQTIIYEMIAPSHDKYVTVDITEYQNKACFRDKDKHKKKIVVNSPEYSEPLKKDDISLSFPVRSNLESWNPAPMQYIWPAASTTNLYSIHAHSCRYFSNNKNATVSVRVYPDIKWRFALFINLSNNLSLKWQKLSPKKHEELRGKALKLANEAKGEYTEVDFGVELKASFDKQENNEYFRNLDLTHKYNKKISSLFSCISSIKKISQGKTSKTKGQISKGIGRKLPFKMELNAPAVYFGTDWEADVNAKHDEIGTKLKLYIEAKPLIELVLVIDLLSLIIQAGVAIVTLGSGNALALEIFNMVRSWAEKGYETENVEIKFKMYIDLEIKGAVTGLIDTSYSTVTDEKEVNFALESNIGIELKSGLEMKGMIVIIGTVKKPELEGHAEGNLSASAKMGLTSGHGLKYDSNVGIFYTPSLKVDPCVGQVILMVKVGFTYKKVSSDWKPVNYNATRTFYEGFDIMKNLAEITGHKNEILFWDKKQNKN
jgi:outer membrane protein OmpA-like peptidoglycan-associated protein